MFEDQRVDLLLDGLKSKHFIGLKSKILCNPTLRSDFNATAAHLKYMVYWSPEIHTPPGCQVSVMGRGRGRGPGTGRGGRNGRAGRDGRGGRGYDSGRGHGGRGNNHLRRSDCIPSKTTFIPKNCPEQNAVDRAKSSIVNRYITGDRIFFGDHVYNTEMNATKRHAMFQIRDDLKAHKDPLGGANRKRNSEVAAMQRSVRELSACVDNYPDNRTEDDCGRGQYPDETDSRSNKNQPGLVRQPTLTRNRKALLIDIT